MDTKKGMFFGWRDVFYFTFRQGTKSKGFRMTTFGIAGFLLIACFLTNVFMAFKPDDKKAESPIETVFVQDESGLEGLDFQAFMDGLEEESAQGFGHVRFEYVDLVKDALTDEGAKSDQPKIVGLHITKEPKGYLMQLIIPEGGTINKGDGEELLNVLTGFLEQGKLMNSNIDAEKLVLLKAPVRTQIIDAGEEDETMGETLVKMLVPIVSIMVMYFMIIIYGQSIGKIVIMEKASKLMETLLTSIKPYAIILGKVLAMACIAISQTFIWIIGGTAGFVIGDRVAKSISPDYHNVLMETIGLLKDQGGSHAFTPLTVVLALLAICFGFLFYSVLAGLVASGISKAEDLSSGMGLFQVMVVISFFLSYYLSFDLMADSMLARIFEPLLPYIPFTAAFLLPGDWLVGNVTILQGCLALLSMALSILLLVVIAGRSYKNKIFYQGDKFRLFRQLVKTNANGQR